MTLGPTRRCVNANILRSAVVKNNTCKNINKKEIQKENKDKNKGQFNSL
jgi:hypothetical protein